MAKAPRQTANLSQLARMPVTPASARTLARREGDARQHAVGNQALQRLLRASASGASDVPPVRPELEHTLESEAGGGQPLSREERSFFEPRFGHDLGDVRLHTDQRAAAAAREVNARAFTRGRDVYFADGQYQPHSDAGRRLMAHELTHTVQQASAEPAAPGSTADVATAHTPAAVAAPSASAGIQRSANPSVIRRQNGDAPSTPGDAAAPMSPKTGVLDEAAGTITFDEITVPGFKVSGHRKALYEAKKPLMRKRGYTRPNVKQRDDWKKGVSTEGVKTKLTEKYNKATANAPAPAEYIFKSPPGGQPRYFMGDLATVAAEMTAPYWTSTGAEKRYDVDHIVELQLNGENTLPNMELLDSKKNTSSGSTIEKNIKAKAKEFITATKGKYGESDAEVAKKYDLVFTKAVGEGGDLTPRVDYWEQKDISAGEQIVDGLSVMTSAELDKEKQIARIFPMPSGTPKEFKAGDISASDKNWLKPYILTAKDLKTEEKDKDSSDFGTLTFTAPESKDWEITEKEMVITVARVPGAQYAGRWDKALVRQKLSTWRKTGLSPIRIDDMDVTPAGMVVTGQISLEEISFLQGVFIDFEMSQGSLTFSKEFSLGDFKAPPPLKVTDTTLKVSVGTQTGVRIDGRVDFKIEKVGDGYLGAAASTTSGFALEGGFNFDKNLFTPPARIDMSYIEDKFKASGVLTIGEGKVKGIKKGTITAGYDAGVLSANGTAELDMPAVQQASMEVKYSEEAGLAIKGKATLKDGIPGIKSGSVEAEVKQGEGGGWMVSATGTATSSIAGFDTVLTISYTDGVFTAEATAGYKTSKLSGTIAVGATNRAVDDAGKPTGGASETLSAFGGGSIEAQLTPWLKGTIGVRIKPEGGVIVSGEIGLPAPIDLFPEKKVEKTLFSISTTIPTPIPGVIVKIGGSLDAYASFGPGQLQNAKIGVVYDPDHEEDTTISGSATFYVPANAGLELGVSAGIGLGITGASVSGNLEIQGGLGIKGSASASAVVNWTPKQGLDLKATAEVEAQPAFIFKVNGFFLVEALGFDIWKPKWNLANFEYGSNLTVGASFPVHYHEGQPFNISFDDVTFKKPDINVNQLLSGLLEKTGL